MEKQILQKYKKEEERLLLSKIIDRINFSETRKKIESTDFLDLAQKNLVDKFLKAQKYEKYLFFGGYEEAERTKCIFYPEKLENLIKENRIEWNNTFCVQRINLPKEMNGKYEHRTYLGAIMKLGIKREKVGDILVREDGADIILEKGIEKLVNINDLTRFSKAKIENIKIEDLIKTEKKNKEITITVSSMRLDNIVSELAKCSRAKAIEELIEQERVLLNFEKINKSSKEIRPGDRITIRGKGRFEIGAIIRSTKKEKMVVQVYIPN